MSQVHLAGNQNNTEKKAHAWWKNQHAAVCCGLCDEEQPLLTNKTKQKNLYWEPAEKQRFICFD